ncbi:FAD/NAD(P)-binding domain-containing protein [Stipitochalara longipes BDJ]|nr:FAD/NAD(P)-binding domain-containing protein [Stipitochalara longipes BDJ]
MGPPTHPKIAIIGSGLSGLALALHLSARNITSTVYEYRPSSYSQGGEIALSPNAARVLDHLGIYTELAKQGFKSDTMTLLNRSGRELGVLKQGSMFGYSALRLKRIFVRDALLKECERRGVKVVFEKEFVMLEERDKKVRVLFEDGEEATVDLVIGADGLRSRVREFVDENAKATYIGTMMIYGNILAETLDAKMGVNGKRFPMPSMLFGKEGSFTIWPRDPDARELGFFANILLPDRSREEWKNTGEDKGGLKEMLEKCFCQSTWPEQVQTTIRSAPAEEFRIWPVNMVPPLTSWSSPSKRIVLIGDAAHAITPSGGQGGAIAFEDAETLAYAISKRGEDACLLEKWEMHRKARVQEVIDFNKLSAKVREASKYTAMQWTREWFIWSVLKIKGAEGYRWLYGYDGVVEMAKL